MTMLDAFFNHSRDVAYFVMLDEPVQWDGTVDRDQAMAYALAHLHITKVNQAFLDLYRMTAEEASGKTPGEFFSSHFNLKQAEWRQLFDNGHLQLNASEQIWAGGPVWMEAEYTCLYDERRYISGYFGVQRDITQQKQAEDTLRESEAKYRSLIDSQESAISTLDSEGVFHYINANGAAPFGTPDFVVGKKLHDLFLPHIADWQLARVRQVIATGQGIVTEYPSVVAGRPSWRRVSIQPIKAGDGPVALATVNSLDITERKKEEAARQESENRLRTVADFTYDMEYWLDENQRLVYISPSCQRITGYSKDEFLNNPGLIQSIIHPEDFERYEYHRVNEFEDKQPQVLEFRITTANQEERWISHSCQAVYSHDGRWVGRRVSNRDITDIKLAEQRLRSLLEVSQALTQSLDMGTVLQLIVDNITQLMALDSGAIYTLEEDHLYLSATAPALPPVFPDEFRRANLADHPHIQTALANMLPVILQDTNAAELTDAERAISIARGLRSVVYLPLSISRRAIGVLIVASTQGLHTFTEEELLLCKSFSGQAAQIIENVRLYDSARTHARELEQQIIERKRVEAALRASESKLSEALEIARLGHWEFDLERDRFIFNDPFYAIFHTTAEQVGGYELSSAEYAQRFLHPEDAPMVALEIEKSLVSTHKRYRSRLEHRILYAGGSVGYISVELYVERDDQGKIVRCYGVNQDITGRKQAEERLRQSETGYRLLVETSIEGIWTMDQDHQTVYVNQAMAEMLGYTPEEMLGKKVEEFFFPEDMEFHRTRMKKRHSGQDEVYERRFQRRDGSALWTVVSARSQKDAQGNFSGSFAMFTDITERKKAEQALRESEEKYRGLMETLDSTVATIDYDGTFLYMNEIAAQQLGSTPQVLIGKKMHELFPEPVASLQLEGVRTVFQQNKGRVTESLSFIGAEPRWFRNSLQPIHDEDGQVAHVLLHSTDIHILKSTQQKLAELNRTLEERVKERTLEIEATHQRLELATQTAGLGVWDWNIKTGQLHWDEQVFAIYGLSPETFQVNIQSFLGIVYPEDVPDLNRFIQHALDNQIAGQIEYRVIRGDGTLGYIKLHGAIRQNAEGQPEHIVGVMQDITSEKLAEKAIRESEETFRAVFNTSPDAIGVFDARANILMMNPAAVQIFNYPTVAEMSGRNLLDFSLPEDIPQMTAILQQMFAQGSLCNIQFPLLHKDGSLFDAEFSIAALYDAKHNPRGILTVTRDITERKRAEKAVHRANFEMARAMRMKDEFLANMSHELRTPLNGILGLSEALQFQTYGAMNEKQIRAIKTIETSGHHLLSLINDILDLSKIEAGKLEVHKELISCMDVCQSSLSFIKEPSVKKGIGVSFILDSTVTTLLADQRRLKQILVNLLSNAIKFTPSGGKITLKVKGNVQQHTVDFSVSDTGIGISPEDLARLFQPFTQVDSSLTRQHEGTGLGLALVKELTEMHGGSVQVTSEVGKGTTFTVTIPWQLDASIQEPLSTHEQTDTRPLPAQEPQDHPATILLAEDIEFNLMTIGDFLEVQGYHMIYALNGHEAIEKARAHSPALILMDVQMPGLDGLEATRQLRADPRFGAVPIIALTAMAMTGDRDRCLEAGATAYVSKPVSLKELAQLIRKLLDERTQ